MQHQTFSGQLKMCVGAQTFPPKLTEPIYIFLMTAKPHSLQRDWPHWSSPSLQLTSIRSRRAA